MATTGDNTANQVKVELYHNHLPRLDLVGFIDWKRETESISRGPEFETVGPVIDHLADNQHVLPEDWP